MHAHMLIGSALVSSSLAVFVKPSAVEPTSPALITPGPQIELLRKQNNDRFMGWIEFSSTWTSMTCSPGNTYYQTGSYWACCATSRAGCANMVVGCVNGNMIYSTMGTATGTGGGLVTRACTQIWTASEDRSYTVCNTGFLYENSLDSNPKSNIFCGLVSSNWSYYRQAPATTQVSSPRSTPPSVTPSSTPASTTPSPGPTSPFPLPDNDTGKKESKAWIAGAVVGPLVGLALIGFGVFFFMRRKKNNSSIVAPATGSVGPAPTAYQQNSYPSDPNAPPGYYPPMQQQNAGAAGFVPVGVQKQDGYYGQPQSPMTQGSQSPNPQSPYGAPQQWQQPAAQPVYGAPSPSMSPVPQNAQPAQYNAHEGRPFSSELEGSVAHGQPEAISVQPKTH